MLLSRYPRVRLGHFPTPLEPLERLTQHLGGPRLYIKRDDCTGLASGRSAIMATAISLFTVAIATASICTVTKKKPLWFLSILLSIAAVIEMIRSTL